MLEGECRAGAGEGKLEAHEAQERGAFLRSQEQRSWEDQELNRERSEPRHKGKWMLKGPVSLK